MNTHHSAHLHGGETVTTSRHDVDKLTITSESSSTVSLFLDSMIAADRVRFLRELSEVADTLADEINLREIERAS
jgi:hypothetical protein